MKNLKVLIKIEKTVNGRLAHSFIDSEPLMNPKLSNEEVGEFFRDLIRVAEQGIDLLKP